MSPGGPTAIAHRVRPFHDRHLPVLVTWKILPGIPSLRWLPAAGAIGKAIRRTTERHARRRTSFRIVHFSLQADHIHLLVEAGSKTTLARGLVGLAVAIARAFNKIAKRTGQLFKERYHARALGEVDAAVPAPADAEEPGAGRGGGRGGVGDG